MAAASKIRIRGLHGLTCGSVQPGCAHWQERSGAVCHTLNSPPEENRLPDRAVDQTTARCEINVRGLAGVPNGL